MFPSADHVYPLVTVVTSLAFWGEDFAETVRLACAAGALSVTQKGAQSGMPTRAQLDEFLAARP